MTDAPRPDRRARYIRSLQYGTLAALLLLIGAFTAPVSPDAETERLSTEVGPVELVPVINTVEPEAAPPPPPPAPPPPLEVPDDVPVEDDVATVEFDPEVRVRVPDLPAAPEREVGVLTPPVPGALPVVQPPPPIVEPEDDPNQVWAFVEQQPELIGGLEGLAGRLIYPELARRIEAEGTVFVEFVVDERGAVTDAVVLRSPHASLAEEALRVVRESRFEPGQQRGRPVKVRYTLPVRFTLR